MKEPKERDLQRFLVLWPYEFSPSGCVPPRLGASAIHPLLRACGSCERTDARLDNGLPIVELTKQIPEEMKPRRNAIRVQRTQWPVKAPQTSVGMRKPPEGSRAHKSALLRGHCPRWCQFFNRFPVAVFFRWLDPEPHSVQCREEEEDHHGTRRSSANQSIGHRSPEH